MSNENENMLEKSVTAIAKSANRLKAVEIKKQGNTIEVIKAKTSDENVINWQDFVVKAGLSVDTNVEVEPEDRKPVVVGYDSAGTAFSRVNIPAVEDKELESMVQLQAESRLPLPANQMELAWRADKENEGQFAITIAAARRQQVQNFIDKITGFKPTNILLDCEGIVKVWKEVFSGNAQYAVIINTDAHNTQICLTKKGKLINAVSLDMGIADFTEVDSEEQAENIERFVQDTRSIVDLFGVEKSEKLQVYILSDESETYNDLVSSLKYEGLNATIAIPDVKKFNSKNKLSLNDIFEYRLQIGLALMIIESTNTELNLFKNIYKPYGEDKQTHWLYSPKIAGAIAAAVLVIFIGVCYAIDVSKPAKIDEVIKQVAPDTVIKELVKRQQLLKAVQAQRPDLLKLIEILTANSINTEEQSNNSRNPMSRRGLTSNGRIQLDSLDFKKGKQVTVTGIASDQTTLYNFEVSLNKVHEISNVTWSPTAARNSSGSSSRASTNSRTSSSRTNSSNTRNRTNNSRGTMGGMNGFDDTSVRFSMEFDYGTFTGASKRPTSKR